MFLYLIRHAQSQNNAKPVYCRTVDPPLTSVGRLQTQYLSESLSRVPFDMLVTSPVLRAVQTARGIHDRTDHHVHVWMNLFEEGGLDPCDGRQANQCSPGKTRSQISQYAALDPMRCTLDPSITESGWWGRPRESADAAACRATEVARRLTDCVGGLNHGAVVVTHAAFKSRLLLNLVGESIKSDQLQMINNINNTGVTTVELVSSVWRLCSLNDVGHLPSRLVTGGGRNRLPR